MTDVIERPGRSTVPAGIRLRPLTPADHGEVAALFARCSRRCLFHRFHGFTDGLLHARQLAFSDDHTSVGAWVPTSCVGVGTLTITDVPEVAVLVEDAWQRQGIGSALLRALEKAARVHGMRELAADVLAEDAFVLRALRRIGPTRSSLARGVSSIRITLAPEPPTPCGRTS